MFVPDKDAAWHTAWALGPHMHRHDIDDELGGGRNPIDLPVDWALGVALRRIE